MMADPSATRGSRLRFPVRTARLTLRPFASRDLVDLLDIFGRPEVVRFLYTDVWHADTAPELLDGKAACVRWASEGDTLVLAIVPDVEDRVVGEVVLTWRSEKHRQGEIGFVVHPHATGRGYAREAAAAMLRIGFETLGLHRIYGRCDARNHASARVMEKLRMRREAHLVNDEWFKGEWSDTLVYAMLETEWRRVDPPPPPC